MDEEKAAGIMTTMEVEAIKESEEPTKPGLMVVQGDEYVRHDGPPPRKSHICCGCCCDTRKAVIVVNIINLCLLVMAVLSISVVASDKFATQVRSLLFEMRACRAMRRRSQEDEELFRLFGFPKKLKTSKCSFFSLSTILCLLVR